MNIIEQNKEKVNGVLKTFDRMIINGYILQLCNYRQFQYYLIQNNIELKDFNKFAVEQTELLCEHIEKYSKTNKVEIQYLTCGKTDKQELAYNSYLNDTAKNGLIAAYSVVEMCNSMTVKANRETKKLEIVSKPTNRY